MTITCERNPFELEHGESCLSCGATFQTSSAALITVRHGDEWLGYLCSDCLVPAARERYAAACRRFEAEEAAGRADEP